MKAILEFDLPEEGPEHSYALAGTDALIVIDEILEEIRSKLKHDCGFFQSWINDEGKECFGDYETLEQVRRLIYDLKADKQLPELV